MVLSLPLRLDTSSRLVVVGDLNGHARLLDQLLYGVEVLDDVGRWAGGSTVVVQIGDLINRGAASRVAIDRVLQLQQEAADAGGAFYWMLGNHEAMTVLQNEAYVTADEYLEFASPAEAQQFQKQRTEHIYELLGPSDAPGRIASIGGRLRAWEEEQAPGKDAFRKAFSSEGAYGQSIRQLPPALVINDVLLVHGGLTWRWSDLGLEGLDAAVQSVWRSEPEAYQALALNNILRDPEGPLWHRAYCGETTDELLWELQVVLARMGAERMVVGHTRTESMGGFNGQPELRQGGRVLMSDVGIGEPGEPGAVLVFDESEPKWWSPIWGWQAFI